MANSKISALTSATTPVAGTETLPIVQSSTTKQVSIANLTAGRAVSTLSVASLGPNGIPITLQEITALPSSATAAYVAVTTSAFPGGANGDLVLIPRTSSANDVRIYVGSGTPTEALVVQGSTKDIRIGSGNIVPATAAKGINFTANTGAAGMTSQLLNWYEEGTWTPNDQSGAGLSFTVTSARYTRIGRQVTVQFDITFPTTVSTATQLMGGLPFVAGAQNYGGFVTYTTHTNALNLLLYTSGGVSYISYRIAAGGSNNTNAAYSGNIIRGVCVYFI